MLCHQQHCEADVHTHTTLHAISFFASALSRSRLQRCGCHPDLAVCNLPNTKASRNPRACTVRHLPPSLPQRALSILATTSLRALTPWVPVAARTPALPPLPPRHAQRHIVLVSTLQAATRSTRLTWKPAQGNSRGLATASTRRRQEVSVAHRGAPVTLCTSSACDGPERYNVILVPDFKGDREKMRGCNACRNLWSAPRQKQSALRDT